MSIRPILFATCLVAGALHAQSFDATILTYEGLDRTCDGDVTPVLRIQNTGGETMTSCDIDILKNGMAVTTFNWNLAVPAASGEVRKPTLPTITGLVPGDELEYRIMTVNSQPDEVATGNILTRTVQGESAEGDAYRMLVEVRTDGDPQETTWTLKDAAGATVASGGPYANAESVERTWVELNPAQCFALRVEDSGGNGMDSRSLPGYVKVISLGEELVNLSGSSFTTTYEDAVRTGADGCALTQLTNGDDAEASCGAQVFLDGTSSISARAVTGATRYQFQFTRGTYLRRIASNGPSLVLAPWSTLPLKPGRTYDVQVRVSFDGGLTYCPFGPACSIRTRYPVRGPADLDVAEGDAAAARFVLFPNPAEGGVVSLVTTGMQGQAGVDLFDLTGRLALQRTVVVDDAVTNQLELGGDLPPGVYIVRVTAGDRVLTDRLVLR